MKTFTLILLLICLFGLFEVKEGEYVLTKEIVISIPYDIEQGSEIPLVFPKGTIIYVGGEDERD